MYVAIRGTSGSLAPVVVRSDLDPLLLHMCACMDFTILKHAFC